jgi:hypothetical protein
MQSSFISLHGQRRLRKTLHQIPAVLADFALWRLSTMYVHRINARRKTQFIANGGVLTILLADILLILIYEFHVLAFRPMLANDDGSLTASQPLSCIANVRLDVFQRLRVSLVTIAGRLDQKTWTAHFGVPVVVYKVMKA